MAGMNNMTAEIAAASAYPNIRLFTVGQKTKSNAPLTQLATIEEPWARASNASLGGAAWDTFSAVCWLFGRDIHDALGATVPIGLVSNNWGGTPVQSWASAKGLEACNGGKANAGGDLYNAMIAPYIVGPMAFRAATWYQGEANVGQAAFYACQFPAMITDWRNGLQDPGLWFGFVQIAGWNYGNGSHSLAAGDLRQAQLAALALPNVGMSTAIDTGDFGNIHPPDKQTVAGRLAVQALRMVYKETAAAGVPDFPRYAGATVATSGTSVSVTVGFQQQGLGTGLTTTVGWSICGLLPCPASRLPSIRSVSGHRFAAALPSTLPSSTVHVSGYVCQSGLFVCLFV